MPVYQIPNKDIGVNRTISGTTTALTMVSLKNPSTGDTVARTTTDSSGDYSFTVDTDQPLTVVVADQNNFENLTEIDVGSAYPWEWYSGGDSPGDYRRSIVRLGSSNAYHANGGGTRWKTKPSYRIIDTSGYTPEDPFSGRVQMGSYTDRGVGEGAEIEIGMAQAGDTRLSSGGSPMEVTADDIRFGEMINRVTVKSIGRNYHTPILYLSGTSLSYTTRSDLAYDFTRIIGGTTYYFTETAHETAYGTNIFDVPSYVSAYPSDYATRIREYYLNSSNGYGEGYSFGNWDIQDNSGSYTQGTRFTAPLPGAVNITSTDDSTVSSKKTSFVECAGVFDGVNPLGVWKNHGPVAYRAIIYGTNGYDATGGMTNNRSITWSTAGDNTSIYTGSPAWARNNNYITEFEFNLLKGYFGSQLITGTMVNCVNDKLGNDSFTSNILANTANLFYQLGDAVYGELNNLFGSSTATLGEKFVGDLIDYWQQGKGTNLKSSDYATRIKPILAKVEAARQTYAPNDGLSMTSKTFTVTNSISGAAYTLDLTVSSGSYGLTPQ